MENRPFNSSQRHATPSRRRPMDAATSPHPTDQSLNAFGLGKLADDSAEAVKLHLEQCPDCRKRVAEMPADSFLHRFRASQARPERSVSGWSGAGGTLSLPSGWEPP